MIPTMPADIPGESSVEPLTKAQLEQARSQLASEAASARWAKTTPEQRSAHGRKLYKARKRKVNAKKSAAISRANGKKGGRPKKEGEPAA